MDAEATIRDLRKRLLIERCVFGGIIFLFIAFWAIGCLVDAKSLILVDGKPVACVRSAHEARDILSKIKSQGGRNASEVGFRQDVRVARAPGNAEPMSRGVAYRTVLRCVSPVVTKWAILVDGKPVVGVPSKAAAGDVLEAAKRKYGQMAHNLAEEPQFKEHVTVDIAAVDPSSYCKNSAEAIDYVFSKSDTVSRDEAYTVGKGDVGGSIAAKCGVKVAQLSAMNPGVNLNRLQIGDRLKIKTNAAKPKLTVIVRDSAVRTETAPAPVQRISSPSLYVGKTYLLSPGSTGQRRVHVETIYENGRKTGSDVVDEQVLRSPVPRRIAVGTKPRR